MINRLQAFFKAFLASNPAACALATLLTTVVGMLGGISLLLLIPLLASLGIPAGNSGFELPILSGLLGLLPEAWQFIAVLGIYIVIISGYAVLKFFAATIQARLTLDYAYQLRSGLYQRLLNTPWRIINAEYSHQITNQLSSNLDWIMRGVAGMLQAQSIVFIALFQFAVALYLSLELTLFALLFIVAGFPLMRWLQKRTLLSGEVMAEQYERLHADGDDFVARFKQIKVHGYEGHIQSGLDRSARRLSEAAADLQVSGARVQLLYEVSAVVSIAVLFYVGQAWLQMPIERLLVFLFVLARLLPRVLSAQRMLQLLVQALPAFESYRDFTEKLAGKAELLPRPTASTIPAQSYRNLAFTGLEYRDAFVEFQDQAIAFRVGELTSISGPSGVGKTTLCDILAGLYPEACSIRLDATGLTVAGRRDFQSSVSYVPQAARPWQSSIRDVLLWGNIELEDEQLWQLIEQVGLLPRISGQAQGLSASIGDTGIGLSGGELQRLMLAQALVRRPRLLILDEITSALDDATERRIIDTLQGFKEDMAVVAATHRPALVQSADQRYQLFRDAGTNRVVIQALGSEYELPERQQDV